MKNRVVLSLYSMTVSVICFVVIVGVMIFQYNKGYFLSSWILFAILIVLFISTLIFAPISVTVDDNALIVNRCLTGKRIPISEIKSIELCQPTMGALRVFGSGGWFGYWGKFRERDLGLYTAYYGKSSDCFFIRLKDGRQYMIGCKNPRSVVKFIKERI